MYHSGVAQCGVPANRHCYCYATSAITAAPLPSFPHLGHRAAAAILSLPTIRLFAALLCWLFMAWYLHPYTRIYWCQRFCCRRTWRGLPAYCVLLPTFTHHTCCNIPPGAARCFALPHRRVLHGGAVSRSSGLALFGHHAFPTTSAYCRHQHSLSDFDRRDVALLFGRRSRHSRSSFILPTSLFTPTTRFAPLTAACYRYHSAGLSPLA